MCCWGRKDSHFNETGGTGGRGRPYRIVYTISAKTKLSDPLRDKQIPRRFLSSFSSDRRRAVRERLIAEIIAWFAKARESFFNEDGFAVGSSE